MQSNVDVRELSERELFQVSGGLDRAAIEGAFGGGISGVQVHTGPGALASSVLGALAYTVASFVLF